MRDSVRAQAYAHGQRDRDVREKDDRRRVPEDAEGALHGLSIGMQEPFAAFTFAPSPSDGRAPRANSAAPLLGLASPGGAT